MEETFFSQNGQDKYIDSVIFRKKQNGSFIEIGAFDGITYSNTLFFERFRNWKGICLEPMPDAFESLNNNRQSININCAVTDFEGDADFLWVTNGPGVLSGLTETYNQEHLDRIKRETPEGMENKIIRVPCITLDNIFYKNNLKEVDYCSIDVEGNELSILRSFDFRKFKIRVFTIENNYSDAEIDKFMYSKGYKLVTKLGDDEVYKKHNLRDKLIIIFAKFKSAIKRIL